jgi:hypothetical protein
MKLVVLGYSCATLLIPRIVCLDAGETAVKGALVELLLILVQLSESAVCDVEQLPVLLAAYTASLSQLDQHLLEVCFDPRITLVLTNSDYGDFVWINLNRIINHFAYISRLCGTSRGMEYPLLNMPGRGAQARTKSGVCAQSLFT